MTDEIRELPYEGDPAWRAPITASLRRVVDPEVALSIVDVGLIHGVVVTDAAVHVRMTMTSAGVCLSHTGVKSLMSE